MDNPLDTNTPLLYKPPFFLPLPHSPLEKNTDCLHCPATGYVYCLATGCVYQKTLSSTPMSSNMQHLSEIMDIHLNSPPAILPQIQIKPEKPKATPSQSQKKKKKRKKVHEPVRKSDNTPTFSHKLPEEACPSGKNTKKLRAKNKQRHLIKADDPSLTPTGNKPPNTKKKPDINTQSYLQAESKCAQSNNVPSQKKKWKKKAQHKKKEQKPNLATTSDTSRTHKTLDTSRTNKRHVPKKVKSVPLWSFIAPFNRRPRAKTHKRHATKKSVWPSKCKNCILASSIHDIVNSQFAKNTSKLMPVTQLRAMLNSGGRKLIPDQEWMRHMEEEAIQKYKKMKADCKYKVQVTGYDVVSHPEKPWLVGLCMWVIDRHTKEKWPLLVKCLYKYPDSRIQDASKHRSFCLRWNEVNYTLKSDHTCYTQMQCLLAITDKIYAELLVHTHKETTIVPVYFDADIWEETEIRLETFYTHNVLPYLKANGMKNKDSTVNIIENNEE